MTPNHPNSGLRSVEGDVSTLLAFIFEHFGRPGDAGALPDAVVLAVRRLEADIAARGSLSAARGRKHAAPQAPASEAPGSAAPRVGPDVNNRLLAAAKGMTSLYPHVWDRTDGSLIVFPENVSRFDAAFDALRIATGEAVEEVEDQDEGTALASGSSDETILGSGRPLG